jgi:hypothetical protein
MRPDTKRRCVSRLRVAAASSSTGSPLSTRTPVAQSNRYAYGNASPTNLADPTGHCPDCVAVPLVGEVSKDVLIGILVAAGVLSAAALGGHYCQTQDCLPMINIDEPDINPPGNSGTPAVYDTPEWRTVYAIARMDPRYATMVQNLMMAGYTAAAILELLAPSQSAPKATSPPGTGAATIGGAAAAATAITITAPAIGSGLSTAPVASLPLLPAGQLLNNGNPAPP